MQSSTIHTNTTGITGIILVRPRYPENIGASARIAFNFGINQLIVVSEEPYDKERMVKMATHKAAHLIHEMKQVATTREAAEPFHFIVATTARQGKQRPVEQTPREVMAEITPLITSNNVAFMFGPENTGLTNEDVDLCQYTSTIPTAGFSSLNLAQAVAIHCYELYTAFPHALPRHAPAQDYANSFDLEGMYEHIEEALDEVTFLHCTNKEYWMRSMRQFLSRIRIKKKEASMIRGICRKFLWHASQVRQTSCSLPNQGNEKTKG
ncbi:RNA methyltransferase [Desulfogranum japonicum]|uniref:RNA methyltransferase n=1 Tax=Desulfogranum japonicum TaxID=231447 RepID=UPI0004027D27|nr:TrmH family RNA methyltransferase [Desulfogranum japonicum]